jgi:hypothetical protein
MIAAFPAAFLEDLIDACVTFPEMNDFSSSNLKYMRFFAQQCPSGLIGQQAADQLPWFHLVTLLTKVSRKRSASGTPHRRSRKAGRGSRSTSTSRTGSTCGKPLP